MSGERGGGNGRGREGGLVPIVEGILISVFSVKHWVKSSADSQGSSGGQSFEERRWDYGEHSRLPREAEARGGTNRLCGGSWSRREFTVTPTVLSWAFPLWLPSCRVRKGEKLGSSRAGLGLSLSG